MLVIFVIIFRAVAIEFRSKNPSPLWRTAWDWAFSISSLLIALIFGIALGNIILGVPLSADKEIYIGFIELLNPYALIVGITTVALFSMHGAIYGVLKTEGELQQKLKSWVNNTIIFFVICYVSTTMITLIYIPRMVEVFKTHPYLFIVAILNMLAIANIPREIYHNRELRAFISSCFSIFFLLVLFAIGNYPYIVFSNISNEFSLDIYNAASSRKTLEVMFTMALIGIPFVLAYTISIYWIFRGKVKIDSMSY